MLTILLLTNDSKRCRYFAAFAGVLATANLPVLLVSPHAFPPTRHSFPTGASVVQSPAASPFPGHLLTELGPAGPAVALPLLGASGLTMLLWLHLRRPATAADAMLRIVVGMAAAILLMPASRFGYLVYPLVLGGLALFFAAVQSSAIRSDVGEDALATHIPGAVISRSNTGRSTRHPTEPLPPGRPRIL